MADLFSGIGGFHLAVESLGGRVVFAAENDRHARITYEANFRPRNPLLFDGGHFAGDITQVDSAVVPDFDLLTAGFPCQPFSAAGRRGGFADSRGTLFFQIARLLDDKRPAAFFLENVPGLRSHDDGRTFSVIQRTIAELGYSFHWKLVRACDFGLPQLRPRVFMVGFRNPATPFVFPEPVPLTVTLGEVLGGRAERDVARTLLASHGGRPHGACFTWDSYLVDGTPHRLTVDEMRRLQGFPDRFVFPVSDAQARKQLGNAVAVPAVSATAAQILWSLNTSSTKAPSMAVTGPSASTPARCALRNVADRTIDDPAPVAHNQSSPRRSLCGGRKGVH